jgi:hypothetical protein
MTIGGCFSRPNEKHLRLPLFELLYFVAQLRELVLSDRSGVTHKEDQYDRVLAPKIT